jgi:hypothetical protein
VKVRILLDRAPGRACIEIDGVDVSHHVRGLSVFASVEGATRVLIDLLPLAVEVEGADVEVVRGLPWARADGS